MVSIFARFWFQLGAILGPKLDFCWRRSHRKIAPDASQDAPGSRNLPRPPAGLSFDRFSIDVEQGWVDFGSTWEPFVAIFLKKSFNNHSDLFIVMSDPRGHPLLNPHEVLNVLNYPHIEQKHVMKDKM